MEKILAIMLLMSLMTVSCGKSGGGSSEEAAINPVGEDPIAETPAPAPEPVPAPTPKPDPIVPAPAPTPISTVPALALSFKTNVDYLTGFDDSDEIKYNKAVSLVKKVIATESFRKKVLAHTYNGVKSFAQNNGLTNSQIYQSLLDAAEKLKPSKNNTMDVGVKLYYENNSVVGWTSPSITYINVNTKFFNSYSSNEVAGNLFHEWLHKLGYGHDTSATARRPYTVPYAVGYMIRDIGRNFL